MAEIFFYHLELQPLQAVLPQLLAKGLERGVRMAVETALVETLPELSDLLWSAEDVSFLAHGFGQDDPADHAIWLCAGTQDANDASYRFFINGALPASLHGLDRALILVDSSSEEFLANARNEWKIRKSEGHAISYWKQNDEGRWVNLA